MLLNRNVEALLLAVAVALLAFGARFAADRHVAGDVPMERLGAEAPGAAADRIREARGVAPARLANVLSASRDELHSALAAKLDEPELSDTLARLLAWREGLSPDQATRVVLADLVARRTQGTSPGAEAPGPTGKETTPALSGKGKSTRAKGTAATPRDREPVLTTTQYRSLRPLLVVCDPDAAMRAWFARMAVLGGAFLLAHLVLRFSRLRGGQVLMPLVLLLSGVSAILLFTFTDPLRDRILYAPFIDGVVAGCVGLVVAARVPLSEISHFKYLTILTALALSALLVTMGTGPAGTDTRITLFGVFQPVEFVKLLVVLFLAAYFAGRDVELRRLHALRVLGFSLPRWRDSLPVVVFLAATLALFFLQRDLGPALVLYLVFLALFVAASRRALLGLTGLGLLVGAFWATSHYGLLQTVTTRIGMWLNPWSSHRPGGVQLAESLWALASGGLWGEGPGRAAPGYIPAGHTDLILSTAGETLGFAGVAAILAVLALVFVVAVVYAWRAASLYARYLGFGLALLIGVQAAIIAAGATGVLPLTGVPLPFMSYGKSAMIAHLVAIGLILNVSADGAGKAEASPCGSAPDRNGAGLEALPYRSAGENGKAEALPYRSAGFPWWMAAVPLAVVALLAVCGWKAYRVMGPEADAVLCRGALVPQADGVRRFVYNPRLLHLTSLVPRGSIVDRNGLPLATDRAMELALAKDRFADLGIAVTTRALDRRVYPLGAAAVHLVGQTRGSWGAPQTAERAEDRGLRGYAAPERTVADAGHAFVARDYSALVPAFRSRCARWWTGATDAIRLASRDVRLTIDARLQLAARDALEQNLPVINGTRRTKAAAVVLDAATGDLLASVSLPAYDPNTTDERALERVYTADGNPAHDRARFEVYPPGSTFKIVTAAAALEQGWLDRPDASTRYLCQHENDVMWQTGGMEHRRHVTDDESEKSHGTLDLHQALVQSCNVYFAWLGTEIGAGALFDTAHGRLGLALRDVASAAELETNLPDNAYGQARVTVSPIEMATIAATIANGGLRVRPRLYADRDRPNAGHARALSETTAATLRAWMIDVVRMGTGTRAAVWGVEVGGKTGTAQTGGDASHSWFVGFAQPEDRSARPIAFAFLVENGGYGGRAAALAAHDFIEAWVQSGRSAGQEARLVGTAALQAISRAVEKAARR
jgi:cell division protein FtsW (lipid II flippase)/beta-lactamase class D